MLLHNLLQQAISLWAVKEKVAAVLQSIQDIVNLSKVARAADNEIEAVAATMKICNQRCNFLQSTPKH